MSASSDNKIIRGVFALLGCAILTGLGIVFLVATVWKAWQ